MESSVTQKAWSEIFQRLEGAHDKVHPDKIEETQRKSVLFSPLLTDIVEKGKAFLQRTTYKGKHNLPHQTMFSSIAFSLGWTPLGEIRS